MSGILNSLLLANTIQLSNLASAPIIADGYGGSNAGVLFSNYKGEVVTSKGPLGVGQGGTGQNLSSATGYLYITNGVVSTAAGGGGGGAATVTLAGDVTGPSTNTKINPKAINDSHISDAAAVSDSKLGTIQSVGKVANSATTATSNISNLTIVSRDTAGNTSVNGLTTKSVTAPGDLLLAAPAGIVSLSSQSGLDMNSKPIVNANIDGSQLTNYSVPNTALKELTATNLVNNSALQQIVVPGLVNNSATTATASNTPNTIVLRDGTGNTALNRLNTNSVEALTSSLNLGTQNTTSTVNMGTGTAVQTINIGTGSGATTINIGGTGDTVNISGTVNSSATNNLNVTNKTISVNVGGAAASGAVSGLLVEEGGQNPGSVLVSSTRNSWQLKAPATAGMASIVPGDAGIVLNQSSHNPVTISNTTANGLAVDSQQVLSLARATSSVTGALSNDDYTVFSGTSTVVAASSSGNNPNTLVRRDASGNFSAGTITATLNGAATSAGTFTGSLAGDIIGTQSATQIAANVITNADINTNAAIADTKLATIATAGKVANSATTATPLNTAGAIVSRDGDGTIVARTGIFSYLPMVNNNGGYPCITMSGGNSTGSIFGNFAKYGDGMHMTYNYGPYVSTRAANDTPTVLNTAGSTARFTVKYGSFDFACNSGANAAPDTVRFSVDQNFIAARNGATLAAAGAGTGLALLDPAGTFKRRWDIITLSAESTNNAGSDFYLRCFDDAGNVLGDSPIFIYRSDRIVRMPKALITVLTVNALTSTGPGNFGYLVTNAGTNDGGIGHLSLQSTGSLNRWVFGVYGNETGSNTGSNLALWGYSDAGVFLGPALLVDRSTRRINIPNPLTVQTALTVNGYAVANTLTLLSGAANSDILTIQSGNVSRYAGFNLGRASPELYFGIAASANDYIAGSSTGEALIYNSNGNSLTLGTPGNRAVIISPTGTRFSTNITAPTVIASSGIITDLGTSSGGNLHWNMRTSTTNRFAIGFSGTETGSNIGSDLNFWRYSDAGTFLGTPINISRSTGNVSFNNDVYFTGVLNSRTTVLNSYASSSSILSVLSGNNNNKSGITLGRANGELQIAIVSVTNDYASGSAVGDAYFGNAGAISLGGGYGRTLVLNQNGTATVNGNTTVNGNLTITGSASIGALGDVSANSITLATPQKNTLSDNNNHSNDIKFVQSVGANDPNWYNFWTALPTSWGSRTSGAWGMKADIFFSGANLDDGAIVYSGCATVSTQRTARPINGGTLVSDVAHLVNFVGSYSVGQGASNCSKTITLTDKSDPIVINFLGVGPAPSIPFYIAISDLAGSNGNVRLMFRWTTNYYNGIIWTIRMCNIMYF